MKYIFCLIFTALVMSQAVIVYAQRAPRANDAVVEVDMLADKVIALAEEIRLIKGLEDISKVNLPALKARLEKIEQELIAIGELDKRQGEQIGVLRRELAELKRRVVGDLAKALAECRQMDAGDATWSARKDCLAIVGQSQRRLPSWEEENRNIARVVEVVSENGGAVHIDGLTGSVETWMPMFPTERTSRGVHPLVKWLVPIGVGVAGGMGIVAAAAPPDEDSKRFVPRLGVGAALGAAAGALVGLGIEFID